jgi:alkylation response protein AidB-like acyl-CoA dehydrogenase
MSVATLTTLQEAAPRLVEHPELKGRRLGELNEMIERTREFARNEIRPRALEIDRIADKDPGYFDWDLVAAGAKLGLLNLVVPRSSGGDTNQICLRTALAIEEIAAGCGGMATLFGAHGLGITPLLIGGPAYWEGVLRDVAASKDDPRPIVMACAITEPTAGTDVEHHEYVRTAQLVSHADKVPGGYRLNGVKCFISNGSEARWITVVMPTDPKKAYETTLGFLVDAQSEGFAVTKVEHKMGQRASPAAELTFDNVFVPDEHVIGQPGDGTPAIIAVLAGSRPVVGGIGTGIARGAYERLLEWLTNDDAASGLQDQQQVQLALAKMHEAIHASRQLYIDAATSFDQVSMGRLFSHRLLKLYSQVPHRLRGMGTARRQLQSDHGRKLMFGLINHEIGDRRLTESLGLSSMSKAHGGDVAVWVTGLALEIAGLDCGDLRAELEKCHRDAKLCQIYEGTNQLNRLEAFNGLVAGNAMHVIDDVLVGMSSNGNGSGRV